MKLHNVEDIYPLSPMQQGMLFHSLYEPKSTVYFEQFVCTLRGDIRTDLFRQAWQQLVDAHGVLRTCFIMETLEQPVQVVRQQVELPWQQFDWRLFSPEQQGSKLRAYLQTDRQQGFIFDQAPLIRCFLGRITERSYYFVMSHHHCLFDGWSLTLLLREVLNRYRQLCGGVGFDNINPRPYRDYIAWLQQQNTDKAKAFWRDTFTGFTAATPLPFTTYHEPGDVESDGRQSGSGCESKRATHAGNPRNADAIQLSTTATRALESLARQHHVTVNTLVQGVWALVLSCYSGEMDVVFGVTTSGRPVDLPGAESMVGLFINTLPIRIHILPDETLSIWLKRIQDKQAEGRQYEYSSLAQVQQWVLRGNGTSAAASGKQILFESIVVFENYPRDNLPEQDDNHLQVMDVQGIEKTNYALTVSAALKPELSIEIAYDENRFSPKTIQPLLTRLWLLLEAMPGLIEQPLKQLPMLTAHEQARILTDWNDTKAEYPQRQALHQLFETQVERTPDAIAVIFEQQRLSYRELNARSNQVGHYLRSLGVGPESLVGICLERSLDMVVGLLGILKAGAAYVPLDPASPRQRLDFMLKDANVVLLITHQQWVDKVSLPIGRVVCLDSHWPLIAHESRENPISAVDPQNPAYVIYTSGSTGRPKAVMLPHRAICNHMHWMQIAFPPQKSEVVLHKTPFDFDASVWEFYAPLLTGARLVIARPGGHRDTGYLINTIIEHQVTTLQLVPSLLRLLLEDRSFASSRSLQRVFSGGECLPYALYQKFYSVLPGAKLFNLYGPTEACIDATCMVDHDADAQQRIALGRPISNTQIYILNHTLQPVPVGAPGELYIGGAGLARGYVGCPELTAEKFIPNPFGRPGSRLYKTGDLGRFLADGNIEFLGRVDNQVKIRGFRVELEEVESVLLRHEAIQACAVIPHRIDNENQSLVAYIVSDKTAHLVISELRRLLNAKLPDHMIPAAFVPVDELPLTVSGKLDRKALPEPDAKSMLRTAEHTEPRDLIDLKMVRIWESVLKVDAIGITDNYFNLGGHSLLAIHLLSEVEQAFGRKFPLSVLFEGGTVKHLSDLIRQDSGFLPQSVLVGIQPTGSKPAFYCVHPAGGNVLCYTDLSRCLGADQPFWGLQDPGLIGEHPGFSSIEQMASFYIQEVTAPQQQGPYFLGGWSMGGLVAYEMAQQLRRQGQEIGLLVLLDVAVPTPFEEPVTPSSNRVQAMATVIAEIGRARKKDVHISVDVLEKLQADEQMTYILEQFQQAGETISKDELLAVFEYAQRYARVNEANMAALRSYRPQPYPGQITLLRVATPDSTLAENAPAYGDAAYGWGHLSPKPVQVYPIPGEHRVMVYDPYAPRLAEVLGHCIDQANQTLRLIAA